MKKKSAVISNQPVSPRTNDLQQTPDLTKTDDRDFGSLLANLREVINTSRQQAIRAVDMVQVRTCWNIGRYIVEFEQGGAARAAYGKGLLADIADSLTAEFGKGFDASNLRYMRLFYQAFLKCDALRHELSWTHYRSLLRIDDPAARLWYMNEAADQNWSTRALDRQIGTLYYERLLNGNEQLFATKYKLVLPTEEELRAELVREQRLLAEKLTGIDDDEEEREK